MNYSQEFIEMKLAAIRACQTRPAARIGDRKVPVAKAASAPMLRAEDMAKRNAEAAAKKAAADKIKADKLAKKQALARLAAAKKLGGVKKRQEPVGDDVDWSPKAEPAFKPSPPRDKVFKTRQLNLDEKIKIKVNDKTWIYVDPGTDIEAVKAKYAVKKMAKPVEASGNGGGLLNDF